MAELEAAGPCIHSFTDQGCPSCVKHRFWYEGRIDGLSEVATLLATNAAVVDAMRGAVVAAEKRDPPAFYNDRLIDRPEPSSGPIAPKSRGTIAARPEDC